MPTRQKSPQINLSRKHGDTPIVVSLDAFFEFSFWMSEELLDLQAQYESVSRDVVNVGTCVAAPPLTKSKRFFEENYRKKSK